MAAARTPDEIVARVNERMEHDFFGFEINDLLAVLPWSHVKQFLKPEAPEAEWKPESADRDDVIERMRDYMEFAWDKANGGRGLSASRSMHHYMAWVWLAGDDLGDLMDYEFYGKDKLVQICEHYGWDHTKWDDGVRTNG